MTPPPTAARLIAYATARLGALPNPQLDAELLFRGVSGLDRAALLTRPDDAVDPGVAERFEAAVLRRESHEPIQYILGRAAFWRDEFFVTPAVLIPRPDTEILVEAVATRLRPIASPTILDLGTGSGCIALSLLRELEHARAVALDVSEGALDVARRNARDLGLTRRIDLRVSNWVDAVSESETFDAVVSNPPYVSAEAGPALSREVREHEPALALFAEPQDDLSSYRAILRDLGRRLKNGGLLAFEVGLGQAGRVSDLLAADAFVGIEVVPDLAGIPRVVLGRR